MLLSFSQEGKIRIAVPDGYFPDPSYIEYVRPGGVGAGADDHKVLYNYILMKEQLQKVGFVVELLEYWDENGAFHYRDWDPIEGGMINRSKRLIRGIPIMN
jgi:predicted SAM-dependent methyltransferase